MGNVQVATATERYLFFQGSVSQIKGKRIFGSTWGSDLSEWLSQHGTQEDSLLQELQERIQLLEQQLAEVEHSRMVHEAAAASALSLSAGWDNPLDAEYDEL